MVSVSLRVSVPRSGSSCVVAAAGAVASETFCDVAMVPVGAVGAGADAAAAAASSAAAAGSTTLIPTDLRARAVPAFFIADGSGEVGGVSDGVADTLASSGVARRMLLFLGTEGDCEGDVCPAATSLLELLSAPSALGGEEVGEAGAAAAGLLLA